MLSNSIPVRKNTKTLLFKNVSVVCIIDVCIVMSVCVCVCVYMCVRVCICMCTCVSKHVHVRCCHLSSHSCTLHKGNIVSALLELEDDQHFDLFNL